MGIGHERARRSIFLERERGAGVEERGYEKFRAAGNEVRSQKGRVHVWTATVICSRIHGHLSAHGPACLLLHRQNSIVPLVLTTSISRHPLPNRYTTQPVHRRFIHAPPPPRLIARLSNSPPFAPILENHRNEFPNLSNQLSKRCFQNK